MSQANFLVKPRIKVTGSRVIPTKPYANEKWEITIEADLPDDVIINQELSDTGETIREALDDNERKAMFHADQG